LGGFWVEVIWWLPENESDEGASVVVPAWRVGRPSGFPAEVPETGPTRIWLARDGCGFAGWAGSSSQRTGADTVASGRPRTAAAERTGSAPHT